MSRNKALALLKCVLVKIGTADMNEKLVTPFLQQKCEYKCRMKSEVHLFGVILLETVLLSVEVSLRG